MLVFVNSTAGSKHSFNSTRQNPGEKRKKTQEVKKCMENITKENYKWSKEQRIQNLLNAPNQDVLRCLFASAFINNY